MPLESLPDELLIKILSHSIEDRKSFINLSSTCKRLNRIANSIVDTPLWLEKRPLAFNLYLELDLYSPPLCSAHGICPEQQYKVGANCELQSGDLPILRLVDRTAVLPPRREDDPIEEETFDRCHYHRLFCLWNAKYRTFSTLRFKACRLIDRGCIQVSFRDSLRNNKIFTEHQARALVELELHDCDITLDWLNTMLNQLENIRYLALNSVSFLDPSILVDRRFFASRCLKRLRITGDRTNRINDAIFMYFLDNFPATELDVTGTRLEYHRRIIQRFYPNANTVDLYSVQPSELILTFSMIFLYLKKYQAVTKRFIADETEMTFACLKRMLQEDQLSHLRISVKRCPLLTRVERERLLTQVDTDELARVEF